MKALERKIGILRCPLCKRNSIKIDSLEYMKCEKCNENFRIINNNAASFLPNEKLSDVKIDIQNFWGDIYNQWYSSLDNNLDHRTLMNHLNDLEDMFLKRRHLAVTEIDLHSIEGQEFLEIGSGGGAHSALFKKYGSDVVAIDITPERVNSTAKKLSLIDNESGVAFAADAENLPFCNDCFDVVYSNGVLHHSENTEICIEEVLRVLKPGGKAIIMLYSKDSVLYWMNLFVKGLISGEMFRFDEAEWQGRITEGKPRFGETKNPITRFYSKREILRLFGRFDMCSLRKGGFVFSNLPKASRLRQLIMRKFGYKPHPGGVIVYGSPFLTESKLEANLGRYVGFCWNIVATKKQ